MAKNIYCFIIPALLLVSASLKAQSKEEQAFNTLKAFYTGNDIEERKALVYDKAHHILSTAEVQFDITKVEMFCGERASANWVFISCGAKECITCTGEAKKKNGANCAIAKGFQFSSNEQALKFVALLNALKKSIGL